MTALVIVIDKLGASPSVTNLVPKSKMFPFGAPKGATSPYVIINRVSEVDWQILEGSGKVYETRVQIECISEKATEADNIGEAVKLALQDVVKETISGHPDTDITRADTDFTDPGDYQSIARRVMDFNVIWR